MLKPFIAESIEVAFDCIDKSTFIDELVDSVSRLKVYSAVLKRSIARESCIASMYIKESLHSEPEKVIVEDSNSGYQFFEAVGKEKGIECESAGGKSNLFDLVKKTGKEETCVIADGAAIGPEMNRLYKQAKMKPNVKLYLPESFEWIILQSGIVGEKEIRTILQEPEQYIDSTDYFSWEQYFTKLLIRCTENTYLQYRKSKLNETYLHEKNKKMILESIKGIKF